MRPDEETPGIGIPGAPPWSSPNDQPISNQARAALKVDTAAGHAFLCVLWAAHDPAIEAWVQVVTRDGSSWRTDANVSAGGDEAELTRSLAHVGSRDVYVTVCASGGQIVKQGDGARAARTRAFAPVLWADVENVHLADLLALDAPPSLVVCSGNGFHGYWILSEVVSFMEDADRQLHKRRNQALYGYLRSRLPSGAKVDQVGDVARVLRLPGTFNRKNSSDPKGVEVVHADARRYDVRAFDATLATADLALGGRANYAEFQERVNPPDAFDASGYTERAITRVTSKSEDRHTAGQDLACDLLDRVGLSASDARVFMRAFQQSVEDARPGKAAYTREEADAQLTWVVERPDRQRSEPSSIGDKDGALFAERYRWLRVNELARERLREERAAALWVPPATTLDVAEFLSVEHPPPRWTVAGLHARGHNTVVVAQFKTGKTTLVLNLLRSWADGVPFLDHFPIDAEEGRVALWNFEMDEAQFQGWLGAVGLRRPDRASVLNLRGQASPLLSDVGRDWTVEWLRQRRVRVWILDPFARAYSGFGDENDNTEVLRWTETVDEIKRRAGVPDLFVVHHTGRARHEEGEERGRGATRLDDWPDTRWLYMRGPDGMRYLRAEGRGVELPESAVTFDPSTLLLRMHGGDRTFHRAERYIELVIAAVREEQGRSLTAITTAVTGNDQDIQQAARVAVQRGRLVKRPDGRAHRHYTPDAVPADEVSIP